MVGGPTMTTIIFDDGGKAWDYDAPDLRVALHCPTPDFDFRRYITETLGFVALTRAQRAARLHLKPGISSPIGLAAALFALMDDPPERLVLSHPDDVCGDEVFVDLRRALDRVAEIMRARSPAVPSRFLHEEQPITALLRGKTPLSALLWRWCDSGATHDPCDDHDLLDRIVRGRFMIVEGTGASMRIIEVGGGFLAYDERWVRQAHGRPVEHQPDYEYGVWVRQFYEWVVTRREPHYNHVDALIRRPHVNDVIRARYRRLLLPFLRLGSKGPRFLSVSVEDETIDLRSARRRAPAVGA